MIYIASDIEKKCQNKPEKSDFSPVSLNVHFIACFFAMSNIFFNNHIQESHCFLFSSGIFIIIRILNQKIMSLLSEKLENPVSVFWVFRQYVTFYRFHAKISMYNLYDTYNVESECLTWNVYLLTHMSSYFMPFVNVIFSTMYICLSNCHLLFW